MSTAAGIASSGYGAADAASGASLRKVYQDRFGWGDGNCVWACVATLFGCELDDLRDQEAGATCEDLLVWSKNHVPTLEYNDVDLATNVRLVGGFEDIDGVGSERWTYDVPTEWEPPVPGFWLASINSLGLKRPVEDPYYPLPALHMVVMLGRQMYHDPNPNYADRVPYEPTVVMQTWWTDGLRNE